MSTSFNCPNCNAVIATSVFSASAPPASPPVTPLPPAPPVVPTVPPFRAPAYMNGRALMETEAVWSKTAGRFLSPGPLTDDNAWLIGFTAGPDKVNLSTAEFGGSAYSRVWDLVDNEDGSIVSSGGPTMAPGIALNGVSSRLAPRIQLVPGKRYTVSIVNLNAGVSSPMVGQLYF